MRETYITKMPDKAGAFMKASEIISQNNGNIVRVSYNKAVDAHTLFIEVDAEKDKLIAITEALSTLGYLAGIDDNSKLIVVEFKLIDKPGAVMPILKILQNHDVNISYINSRENGTEFQYFKMGLLIDDADSVKGLLDEVSKLCDVRILDYDATERPLDNTVFYLDFANEVRQLLSLTQSQTNSVIIYANRIMQLLDDKKEAPLKTFEYILKFVKFIKEHKGNKFQAKLNTKRISSKTLLHIVEPPCGSNSFIFKNNNGFMFVDCGFACFHDEMLAFLRESFPDFDKLNKSIILTHADIDHAGLLSEFDKIYLSQNCYNNFQLENNGDCNFREQNILHSPYCSLSKIITEYRPPNMEKLSVIGQKNDDSVLSKIGFVKFGDIEMEIYEGNGGHVKGETIIICEKEKIIFTGDCLVNINGFSEEQKAFNALAPYLMQSVNVDSLKATACRKYLLQISNGYLICPGHGNWFVNEK